MTQLQNMNYLMMVDDRIQSVFQGEVIGLFLYDVTEHKDYWERRYYVAWQRNTGAVHSAGTHMVCVDSRGRSMAISGNYLHTAEDALIDLLKRQKRVAVTV